MNKRAESPRSVKPKQTQSKAKSNSLKAANTKDVQSGKKNTVAKATSNESVVSQSQYKAVMAMRQQAHLEQNQIISQQQTQNQIVNSGGSLKEKQTYQQPEITDQAQVGGSLRPFLQQNTSQSQLNLLSPQNQLSHGAGIASLLGRGQYDQERQMQQLKQQAYQEELKLQMEEVKRRKQIQKKEDEDFTLAVVRLQMIQNEGAPILPKVNQQTLMTLQQQQEQLQIQSNQQQQPSVQIPNILNQPPIPVPIHQLPQTSSLLTQSNSEQKLKQFQQYQEDLKKQMEEKKQRKEQEQ
ncbi:MAG: hypothetical protein EZS28_027161 [Streblomastix strix]|uniref:Uncharacterized protein n=1 Tax=Streblomastix strix TaxID=222440 RepID=A0A5J4V5D6_9EUKA|nr:MAG: hypothetical protein EZS28_027161 [Streblomastix strix]